ncbi:MAG: transposase family protein [Chloroflexi bacterium]|nr:MAG: transposase family protein [Chloroflexota bacterium]
MRFTRPGHAVTGDRHRTGAEKRARVGYEWVNSLVDDHSRLAYSELHLDERAATVTAFVERGLAFYAAYGIEPKRLLSDNAFVYRRNRSLAELLADKRIRHLLIPIRRPAGQRQGRALPADAQTRVGAGRDLPLLRPPRPSTVTLAALLQRAQTTQLARRQITAQPCPQRPEAGHLDAEGRSRDFLDAT